MSIPLRAPRAIARVLLASAALACATPARTGPAQVAASAPACTIPPATDSVNVAVVARATALDESQVLPPGFADELLFELGGRLRMPTPLPVNTYEQVLRSADLSQPARAFASLDLLATMRLTHAGQPQDVQLLASSLSPAFDAAVLEAIASAVRDSALPRLGPEVNDASIPVRLLVTTTLTPADDDMVLFRMRVPALEVTPATVLNVPVPAYPAVQRMGGIQGRVDLRVIVTENGLVAANAVRVVRADDLPFLRAVLGVLGEYRFAPAKVGGCPVATVYQLPVEFTR
jgi:TonB family protein